MLAQYKTRTNIGVGLGLIGELIGRFLIARAEPASVLLGLVILVAAMLVFIWGCMQYAKAKGHSEWFGLLGLLSLIGLLVLFFLPDRHKFSVA